jgi:hypothetical protein
MINAKIEYKKINEQMLEFEQYGKIKKVYCPFTDEYEITIDVVLKVSKLGANILIFPTSWCRATREAIEYGKTLGVEVMPVGAFMSKYANE